MPVVRCLVCNTEYSSVDSFRCPKCKYPTLALSGKPDLHRRFKLGYIKDHASDKAKKYGLAKDKQIKCVICSNKYMLSELHCPKCQYPAISFTKQTNRFETFALPYKRKRINSQRVILDRPFTSQELDAFVKKYPEGIQKEIISGYMEYANGGNPYAQYNLGMLYYYGYGVGKDEARANSLFRKAALRGVAEAQYMRGSKLLDDSQVTDGKEWLEKEGAQWIEKAAYSDHPDAQYYLGKLFLEGRVLAQDYKKAAIWFIKAAAKGSKEAAYELSVLFREGKGVTKDNSKADKYYKRALELGYRDLSKKQQSRPAQGNISSNSVPGKAASRDYQANSEKKKPVNKEDPEDQYNLGNSYYFGDGVRRNYKVAVEWYRKAAEQGHAEAQYALGNSYYFGKGVEQDYKKAAEWYRKAAKQGHANAQKMLNLVNRMTQSNTKNEERNSKAPSQGKKERRRSTDTLPKAGNNSISGSTDLNLPLLTRAYTSRELSELGEKVPRVRLLKIVSEYRKYADMGSMFAKANLGMLYARGYGVQHDQDVALKLLKKPSEKGIAEAQFFYGCILNDIKGRESEGTEWIRKAAEQGHAEAADRLSKLNKAQNGSGAFNGNRKGAQQDKTKAEERYHKNVKKKEAEEYYQRGNAYYFGEGVKMDYTKAAEWYLKAAEQGHAKAQERLGDFYKYGDGVERDYTKAEEWYLKAAAQRDSMAYFSLAQLYYYYLKDYKKAAEWYLKDARRGSAVAQCRLGELYEKGEGVRQDREKAVEWYRKAAAQGDNAAKIKLAKLNIKEGILGIFGR